MWHMAHCCLPTHSRLLEKGLPIEDTCVHCEHHVETHSHFFRVPKSHEVLRINWVGQHCLQFIVYC
jgi:hypothetical protein